MPMVNKFAEMFDLTNGELNCQAQNLFQLLTTHFKPTKFVTILFVPCVSELTTSESFHAWRVSLIIPAIASFIVCSVVGMADDNGFCRQTKSTNHFPPR
jgi:hypothetical protein